MIPLNSDFPRRPPMFINGSLDCVDPSMLSNNILSTEAMLSTVGTETWTEVMAPL